MLETNLKIRPHGRNEGPRVLIVNESSESSSCDDDKEYKEQI